MREAGLSAAGLASRIGRHETQVGRWLNGSSVPDWRLWPAIAEAVGQPARYLFAPILGDPEDVDVLLLEAENLLRSFRQRGERPQEP